MPASEIMEKFRAGTLHSGKDGKIVKSARQARAIKLSYLRKEGYEIPYESEERRKGDRRQSKPA